MMFISGLSSAVGGPGLGALAHRRPRASARRALRGVIAQSEKPERSNIHPNRDESPPKNVYAQEGKAAGRLEAAEVSEKFQQTQKQCNCKENQEGYQKSQAAERQDASTGQTQWDGEGQDYDMEEVVQYSKERHDRETGKGGDREMSQGGDRGGKGGVGEEAGVQDVE